MGDSINKITVFLLTAFLTGILLLHGQSARADGKSYKGVWFPLGDRSFADGMVSFNAGSETEPPHNNPTEALYFPDNSYVSLGHAGTLVVRFSDNYLIDVEGPDLYIFETGTRVEPFLVEISQDGSSWIDLGQVEGQPTSLDIHDKIIPGDKISYVRLTDVNSGMSGKPWAGADIDAIGAIGAEEKLDRVIAVTPDTIDFGYVDRFSTKEQIISIENIGTEDLTISDISITGDTDQFEPISLGCEKVLPAGSHCTIPIIYHPTLFARATATVTITSDDPDYGQVDVVLTGYGAVISVEPDSVAFGTLQISQTESKSIVITNKTNVDLGINFILSGQNPNSFDLSIATATLHPVSSRTIVVDFSPIEEGQLHAVLTIQAGTMEIDVPLSGIGTADPVPTIKVAPESINKTYFSICEPNKCGIHVWESFSVTISNQGQETLKTTEIMITGPDAEKFILDLEDLLPCKRELEYKDSCELKMSIRLDRFEVYSATLTIESNDPDGPVTIPMKVELKEGEGNDEQSNGGGGGGGGGCFVKLTK